jgi:hypothetical protein
MHVAQPLDPLALGPHIEVVEPGLPDMLCSGFEQRSLSRIAAAQLCQYTARKTHLQRLHHDRRIVSLGLAHQQNWAFVGFVFCTFAASGWLHGKALRSMSEIEILQQQSSRAESA